MITNMDYTALYSMNFLSWSNCLKANTKASVRTGVWGSSNHTNITRRATKNIFLDMYKKGTQNVTKTQSIVQSTA